MYYSVWDINYNEFFETGLNSKTRHECILAIWQHLTFHWEDKRIENTKISDVLSNEEVEIIKHKDKITDLDIHKLVAQHNIDEYNIDEYDEYTGDGFQRCSVWCNTHKKYEWHEIYTGN